MNIVSYIIYDDEQGFVVAEVPSLELAITIAETYGRDYTIGEVNV